MEMLKYREMSSKEKGLIEQIDATCHIKNAWRMNSQSGELELTEMDWTDHELPNGLDWHIEHFDRAVSSGGKAFGCFDQNTLVGYATVDAHVFDMNEKYVLLDQLFVSNQYRGKGIGKALYLRRFFRGYDCVLYETGLSASC
jgi:GNAT superfamily N-acetyltransferase